MPWAPGGSTDILARAIAEQLTKSMGQPVIVDNKAGASGNIGSNIVAKAKPDGYTLLIGSMSTHAMNPALMANMPFKGADDFTPIALVANVINTMVINPSVPAKNVQEFIAYAKANPGKLAYASAGGGSTNHLSGRDVQQGRRHPDAARALQGRCPGGAGHGRATRRRCFFRRARRRCRT